MLSARYAPGWHWSRLWQEVLDVGPEAIFASAKSGSPVSPSTPGAAFFLSSKNASFEMISTNVVEERGELLLLPLPCGLPYALQRL